MASLVVLLLVVLSAVAVPFYATHIAQTDPFESNLSGTTTVDGKVVPVIQPNPSGLGSTPIGPTLERHYFLGADSQGRDVMARLLYGGRPPPPGSIAPAPLTAPLPSPLGPAPRLFRGVGGGGVSPLLPHPLGSS